MEQLALEIGRAIRRARLDRGMTLKELAESSAGRFRPTSLAGYERGERTISVVRFCELCRLLDVPPGRLLQEITGAIYGHGEPTIDLDSGIRATYDWFLQHGASSTVPGAALAR